MGLEEHIEPATAGPIAERLAAAALPAKLSFAYPGLWLRDDVYAFHGHYLDLHMAMPRLECVLGQAMARRMLGPDVRFGSAAGAAGF